METANGGLELSLLCNGGGVGHPRDLLRQLSADKFPSPAPESVPSCDIELSLGLSLGGSFGTEKSPRNVLKKSASISFAPFLQSLCRVSESGAPIKRTISLPAGNAEKKRKLRDAVTGNHSLGKAAINGGCERTKGMMEEMPCVSTTGTGPNGRRIEGFLYRYSKREEVKIVCVCHGKFLSPAEFVKHAGGRDVDHPLKHIIVDPPRSCIS